MAWHRRSIVVGLLALGLLGTVGAEATKPVDNEVKTQTQRVIESQLQAFARDDAEAAFAHASPAIQSQFKTPQRFMAMVQQGYRVVYRHQTVRYVAFALEKQGAEHQLQMVDDSNQLWTVFYRLEKMPDGHWKISACEVQRASGTLI